MTNRKNVARDDRQPRFPCDPAPRRWIRLFGTCKSVPKSLLVPNSPGGKTPIPCVTPAYATSRPTIHLLHREFRSGTVSENV